MATWRRSSEEDVVVKAKAVKLALVVDKEEAYLNFQRDAIFSRWEVNPHNAQEVTSLGAVGGATLFGDAPTSLMTVTTSEEVKALVKALEAFTPAMAQNSFSSGLLVLTTANRNATKKLEALVASLGGEVLTPPGKGEGTLAEKIIGTLNLQASVRSFALAYVGNNYTNLISLVESFRGLAWEDQRRITEEDVLLRFPQPKGEVPPWEVEKPLMRGDLLGVREVLHRAPALVVIAVMRNKLQLAFRIAALKAAHPSLRDEEVAEKLGVPKNYPFTLASKLAKERGVASLMEAVQALEHTESSIKGASAAPAEAVMDAGMAQLCEIFKRR